MLDQSDPFFGIRLLMLLSLTLLSAISDIRNQRIPNRLIASFLLLGCVAWTLGHGALGLWYALAPACLVLLSLFPIFMLRALAGGDVKLFAAIAGISGFDLFMPVFVMSLLMGGIVGFVIWVRHRAHIQWKDPQIFRVGPDSASAKSFSKIRGADIRFPFAAPIFLGTVLGIMGYGPVPTAWLPLL